METIRLPNSWTLKEVQFQIKLLHMLLEGQDVSVLIRRPEFKQINKKLVRMKFKYEEWFRGQNET